MTHVIDNEQTVTIQSNDVELEGLLHIPYSAQGVIVFAHGSGSSRLSPRNHAVARVLQKSHFATLLFDLLTEEEDAIDERTKEYRFDIELLAARLLGATKWLLKQTETQDLPIGYFGASTGAGAALMAAADAPKFIKAVVSRGGRPDLASSRLAKVKAATLLIVGGNDPTVIELNKKALRQLNCIKEIQIVPDATHLFEEKGKLEIVAELANEWFKEYLAD